MRSAIIFKKQNEEPIKNPLSKNESIVYSLNFTDFQKHSSSNMNRAQMMLLQNNCNQLNNAFVSMNLNNNQNFMNNSYQPINNNANSQQKNNMNNSLMNELNNYKNENKKLQEHIIKLQQEINRLNNNLQNANQNVINLQQQQVNYINQINDLKLQLMNKERELNDIKKDRDGYVNYKNIKVVHFNSGDGKIDHGIKCLSTETFAEVEEKLYKIYGEYRDAYNNTFLANGNIIKRYKTMSENNIKNGDKILLQDINENN